MFPGKSAEQKIDDEVRGLSDKCRICWTGEVSKQANRQAGTLSAEKRDENSRLIRRRKKPGVLRRARAEAEASRIIVIEDTLCVRRVIVSPCEASNCSEKFWKKRPVPVTALETGTGEKKIFFGQPVWRCKCGGTIDGGTERKGWVHRTTSNSEVLWVRVLQKDEDKRKGIDR